MKNSMIYPIVQALHGALERIKKSFSNEEEFELFMAEFGWDAPTTAVDLPQIVTAFDLTDDLLEAEVLLKRIWSGETTDQLTAAVESFAFLKSMIETMSAFDSIVLAGQPFPLNQGDFWIQMKNELLDYLIIQYLKKKHKYLFATLHLFQVIQFSKEKPVGNQRIDYKKHQLNWSNLAQAFSDPAGMMRTAYQWNNDPSEDFDHVKLLDVLETGFLNLGSNARRIPPRPSITSDYLDTSKIEDHEINELELPLFKGSTSDTKNFFNTGLIVLPIPDTPNDSDWPSGIMIQPVLEGLASAKIPMGNGIFFEIKGGFESGEALRLELFNDAIRLATNLDESAISGQMAVVGKPETPWVLLGDPEGNRLELEGFKVALGVKGSPVDPDIYGLIGTGEAGIDAPKLALILNFADAGGLLQKLFGNKDQRVEFGGNLRWSSKHGLKFEGSAGLELTIPIQKGIPGIEITNLYLGILADQSSVKSQIGIGAKVQLGPLHLRVENVGLEFELAERNVTVEPGLFGSLDVQFGLKEPSSVGVDVSTPSISGGGYLSIDTDGGQYAGVLDLWIMNKISVKGFCIINTKRPDGSDGFSMIISLMAGFPGIELGFGFALTGLGGLLGLHRTINIPAMRQGVKDNSISQLMFPEDAVKNAPTILNTMGTVFPVKEDQFVMGLMAQISYKGGIMTGNLGVILEISNPTRFGLMGVVILGLPTPEEALIRLQVNFLGVIDFTNKELGFYASLYKSHFLGFKLYGDLIFKLNWGDTPGFGFSVGGFHPDYKLPALLKEASDMKRLRIEFINSKNLKLYAETYLAVTSNSVQFGAKVEFKARFGLTAHAWFQFDALFQFNPFLFTIGLKMGLSVRVAGVSLAHVGFSGKLRGPAKYHVNGKLKVKLFFFSKTFRLSKSWGEEQNVLELAHYDVVKLIKKEVEDQTNWSTSTPKRTYNGVAISKQDTCTLALSPDGKLVVQQQTVPLNYAINRFGDGKPKTDAAKYALNVRFATIPAQGKSATTEDFALSLYREYSDAEKLQLPSFEKLEGGLQASPSEDALEYGAHIVDRESDYETFTVDYNKSNPVPWEEDNLDLDAINAHFDTNHIGKQGLLTTSGMNSRALFDRALQSGFAGQAGEVVGMRKTDPLTDGKFVEYNQQKFAVANLEDLTHHEHEEQPSKPSVFETEAQAIDYLAELIKFFPHLEGELVVLPEYQCA